MKKRLFKYARRLAMVGILLAIVGLLARNMIARSVIAWAGGYALGNDVSVGKVEIGWSAIRLSGLAVRERKLDGQPQLLVEEILLEPTIWRGLRKGVWAEKLAIRKPEFFLRFDATGNLLSHFPSGSKKEPQPLGKIQVPLRQFSISDASFSVSQLGKQTIKIADVNCAVTADDRLGVRATIGNLLGTQAALLSNVDATTFEGKTSLEMQPMHLDCKQLSQLALVPDALGKVAFSTDVYCAALIEHPANDLDLRNHDFALRVDITDLKGKDLADLNANSASATNPERIYSAYLAEGYSEYVSIRGRNDSGRCVLDVTGPVCGGDLRLHSSADLHAQVPRVQAQLLTSSVDVGRLLRLVSPDVPVEARANIQAKVDAKLESDSLIFSASLDHSLNQIVASGIAVDPVNVEFSSTGRLDVSSGTLSGTADVVAASDGVELKRLSELARLDDLDGRVAFKARAHVPLASVANPETYAARVDVYSTPAKAAGFAVTPIQVSAQLADGQIELNAPTAVITVQEDAGAMAVATKARVGRASQIAVQGSAKAALLEFANARQWTGSAAITTQEVTVAGERLSDLQMQVNVDSGLANIVPFELAWRETRCRIGGQVDLGQQPIAELAFEATPIPLRDIGMSISQFSKSPLALAGTAQAKGNVAVELLSGAFNAGGTLELSNSTVQQFSVGDAHLNWSATKEAVQLQSSSADFFGGQLACGAILRSLDWTTTQVIATCENIQLSRLVPPGLLPATVSGAIFGQVSLNEIASIETLNATGKLGITEAKLGSIPFSVTTEALQVAGGQADVKATAQVAGGNVELVANANLPELIAWQKAGAKPEFVPVEFSVQTTSINAKPFIVTFDRPRKLRDLRIAGSLSAVRNRDAIRDGILCYANGVVDYVGYKNSIIATRLSAEIIPRMTDVKVRKMSGKVAGGSARGELDLAFAPLNGRYRLSLENASLRRALAPVPSLARDVSGSGSIAVDGRIGGLCTANVRMKASNVVASGLAIREIRMPLTADYQIAADRATWRTRGASIQTGGGTVSIDSEGSVAKQIASFTTGVRIANVDTAKLMRGKSVNAGIVGGSINLRARRARAPEDIVGNFTIELSQLQGFEVPGFDQLLSIAKMPSFTANKLGKDDLGIIHGRLGGGLVHIDDATLSKSGILVLMDGTATLAGRLNMDITAITNQSGPADGLVDLANSPLMLAAPAPVALIAKANDALKDRVIYAAVTGTASRPTIHVQPGKSLSQDTLRFVLSTAIGNQAANMAVRRPSQNTNR